MYGLINRGVEEQIASRFRGAAPGAMEASQEFSAFFGFLRQQRYCNGAISPLVDASSDKLTFPHEEVLVSSGEFWVQLVTREHDSNLFDLVGRNLLNCFMNFELRTSQITVISSAARMPSVECTVLRSRSVRAHYGSSPSGLVPVQKGTIEGLGERFGTEPPRVHEKCKDGEDDHDVFSVTFQSPVQ